MISEEDAREKILEAVQPLPPRRVAILQALDQFAAEDYFAENPLPGFDNSAMDGYAVMAADAKSGKRLRVIGEQPAGLDRQLRVGNGQTVRIFTGAPVPAGADAVVMQEDVTREGDEIAVNTNVEAGEFVRRRGCDLSEGQKIVTAGERVRSATLGILASQGFNEISIGGQARVGIVSSGDELARPGESLQPGQIYDSNLVMLQGLVKRSGALLASAQHCRDDADALRRTFESGAGNEVLVVTGGVSVGEHDLVQSALRALGAKIEIWRVAIKPGKPFLFAQLPRTEPLPPASAELRLGKRDSAGDGKLQRPDVCLVFGLPGNPVSAFVTFLQFVRPTILRLMGAADLDLPRARARLTVGLTNDGDRAHYFRGKLQNGEFAPVGRQESHAIFGLSQSNSLFRLAAGSSAQAGDVVEIETWD